MDHTYSGTEEDVTGTCVASVLASVQMDHAYTGTKKSSEVERASCYSGTIEDGEMASVSGYSGTIEDGEMASVSGYSGTIEDGKMASVSGYSGTIEDGEMGSISGYSGSKKNAEIQTDNYSIEKCGCATENLQAMRGMIRKEIWKSVKEFIKKTVEDKEAQLELIQKYMEDEIKKAKEKRWCRVCGNPAQIYSSNAYYCCRKCEEEENGSQQ